MIPTSRYDDKNTQDCAYKLLAKLNWEPDIVSDKIRKVVEQGKFETAVQYGDSAIPYIIKELRPILKRPNTRTMEKQASLLKALVSIGTTSAMQALQKEFVSGEYQDFSTRELALALAEFPEGGRDFLLKNLEHNDPAVWRMAIFGLHRHKASLVLTEEQEWIMAISARDWPVLQKAGDRAIPVLIKKLDGQNNYFLTFVDGMTSIGTPRAMQHLEKRLMACKDKNNANIYAGAIDQFSDGGQQSLMRALTESCHSTPKLVAADVLGPAHKDVSIPVLKALKHDWNSHPDDGQILKKLGYQPETSEEEIYLWVSLKNKRKLRENFQSVKELLFKDMAGSNRQAQLNAASILISLGDDKLIPDLIRILNEANVFCTTLAEVYYNCGQNSLQFAAKMWAIRHKYRFVQGRSPVRVSWGR